MEWDCVWVIDLEESGMGDCDVERNFGAGERQRTEEAAKGGTGGSGRNWSDWAANGVVAEALIQF